MGFDFRFRCVEGNRDLRGLVNFLMTQNLGYQRYEEWVQKAEHEIRSGYKTAILAMDGGRIVGDLVFQKHKQLSRVREIKNLRIAPEYRRRDFAHFMIRQAESELPSEYDALIVDARAEQRDVIAFFRLCGYMPISSVSLYDPNNLDVVMVKSFDKTSTEGVLYNTKKIVDSKINPKLIL